MLSLHDLLRRRLLEKAGLWEMPKASQETLEEIRKTAWSTDFETMMRNRLIMGHLRYGSMWKNYNRGVRYNYIKSIKEKIDLYIKTGNTELLVDVANYCMLEFHFGDHPKKHFAATDDQHHCELKD